MDEQHPNPAVDPHTSGGGESSQFCPFACESPSGLSEIALKRRDQIMDAAEAIIAREGIHRLSLGHIEKTLGGMSRGQLTYYFPNKESILLAVFGRMLRRMVGEMMRADGPKPMTGRAWDCVRHGVRKHLDPAHLPGEADLSSLFYTFLAQMGHRPDYRDRLAQVLREGREFLAADIAGSVPAPRPISPRVSAALIQALFHGLRTQLAVDPNAFDRDEMFAACVQLLAPLFNPAPTDPQPDGVSS
ncbi:MAG: transcriptional regulator BetI [Gemmataceae bacterium]|nr:transcriptional regulator BetI [Gemmataceae bacterium]